MSMTTSLQVEPILKETLSNGNWWKNNNIASNKNSWDTNRIEKNSLDKRQQFSKDRIKVITNPYISISHNSNSILW